MPRKPVSRLHSEPVEQPRHGGLVMGITRLGVAVQPVGNPPQQPRDPAVRVRPHRLRVAAGEGGHGLVDRAQIADRVGVVFFSIIALNDGATHGPCFCVIAGPEYYALTAVVTRLWLPHWSRKANGLCGFRHFLSPLSGGHGLGVIVPIASRPQSDISQRSVRARFPAALQSRIRRHPMADL